MREKDFSTEAEGLTWQQGLGGAISGAGQGAAAGTSVLPGWGTLFGALAGAGVGLAQAASAPSPQARPARPQPPPRPVVPPPAPSISQPVAPPVPVAAPAVVNQAWPAAASAASAPSAGVDAARSFDVSDVAALLQNPNVQELLRSFAASQATLPAASAQPAYGRTTGLADAESVGNGNALDWLLANRVARLT